MNKIKPTHKHLELPPAISSLTFNEEGLLKSTRRSWRIGRVETHMDTGVFTSRLGEDISLS